MTLLKQSSMGPLVIPSIFSFSSILFFLVELDARPRRTGAGLLRPPTPTPAPSARSATAIAPALASSARPAPPAASSARPSCTRPVPLAAAAAIARLHWHRPLPLALHGLLDRPPARGRPPWSPWRLLLLAHGRAAQPHLLPTPTAARAGAGLRLPRAHGLTEEDDVDVGRVGPLESDGSTQPASKEYIPLQGPTQPIQPTNQTRVDVGRTRPNPFRPTNQTQSMAAERTKYGTGSADFKLAGHCG